MRAAIFYTYGEASVLRVADVPRPAPRATELLIKVGASSINPADIGARSGLLRLVHARHLPHIPGYDVAGEIVASGAAVTTFVPGERVFALVGLAAGAQAEYVCVDQSKLARIPQRMSFADAAVVPLAGLTALQALRGIAQIRPGQRVLISGATGGVGSFAVQLAKFFGCRVTAVCRGEKRDVVLQLGADEVIDYKSEAFTASKQRWDAVYDAAGAYSFRDVRPVLRKSGIMVTSRPSPGSILPGLLGRVVSGPRYSFHVTKARGQDLALLSTLIDHGVLRPLIDRHFSLEQIQEAHRYFEAGGIVGKVGVQIARA